MTSTSLPAMITDLQRPDRHTPPAAHVELLQTHISWVIIADQLVYKIKKPVDFGFIDYSTLEKRKFYCQEELRLNRRLSAGVYLRVEPIVKRREGYFFGGEGEVVDYAVVMKKLPRERLMVRLLARGELTPAHVRRLARRLAEFYRQAAVIDDGSFGTLDTVAYNIRENFTQTEKYLGRCLSEADYRRLIDYNERFFAAHEDLFARRVAAGMIKECHGDLHMEHVCFTNDHLDIYDCIEFNDRFRLIDVVADIAFMAMDLDYHDRYDLAAVFLAEFAGSFDDADGRQLLPLYKCYRAYVRGKVISFLLDDPSLPAAEKERAAARARRYFRLATVYTYQPAAPMLLLVTGISGSGKSYLAGALAGLSGFLWLRSDQVRKELAGLPPTAAAGAAFQEGLYSPVMTRSTYDALARRADRELEAGRGVIVDATCLSRWQRQLFLELAGDRQVPVKVVSCTAPWEVVAERLQRREEKGGDLSDADRQIAARQLEARQLPTAGELAACSWIEHDTTPELLDQLYRELLDQLYRLLPRLAD
ncbi:MAG: AAA family ATPase [Deltaproteobacteria bacterium]|nr:AAA family ATPase [Deltaproteobacteria bacterium]